MKLIQCIIQPYKLEEVIDALQAVAPGMTLSEAKGHGHQRGQPLVYRGHEYEVSLLPKVMIEIVVEDNRVDDVVKVVIEKARTGHIGDGRIFISRIEESYHIRSGFMALD
ncbi:MAG TPA: P-II family nitrogen regulator [Terriglobia bacterium]